MKLIKASFHRALIYSFILVLQVLLWELPLSHKMLHGPDFMLMVTGKIHIDFIQGPQTNLYWDTTVIVFNALDIM